MFIELTDLLRCPAAHDEAFLVLIPDQMQGRSVRSGVLGCPVCRREFRVAEGVAVFELNGTSGTPALPVRNESEVDSPSLLAFLGLEGPGGYVGLFGSAAARAGSLSRLLPDVHFVALNPPESTGESAELSVVRSPTAPFRSRSLRGVVVGSDAGIEWQREAVRCVLPGLRVVGEGKAPSLEDLEPMAEAGGWWVGRKAR